MSLSLSFSVLNVLTMAASWSILEAVSTQSVERKYGPGRAIFLHGHLRRGMPRPVRPHSWPRLIRVVWYARPTYITNLHTTFSVPHQVRNGGPEVHPLF